MKLVEYFFSAMLFREFWYLQPSKFIYIIHNRTHDILTVIKMKLMNRRRTGSSIVWSKIVVRGGGLPSSVVGVRAPAFFCCLWMVDMTNEGKEEASGVEFKILKLNEGF